MSARLCAIALLVCSAPALAERRAALLVGENAGDENDAPLLYAESDAAAMREVLVRLGGVSESDATLLRGATAADLRGALQALSAKLQRDGWGKSDRLTIYISSHASSGELHLRGSRFPLADLRHYLDSSPAGVALLILDTCESGRAVRAKGLVPLATPELQIERPSPTGRVVIASSGAEESAFESDELGGSLFTQHFIAGLRGAADTSHDGQVSLQEAYAYAYARTIDSAAAVHAARQTPQFDIDLKGEGELVLSEPSQGRARLKLDLERPGEWVVAPMDGSAQVLRFVKPTGAALFALSAGSYRLRTRVGDVYQEKLVQLVDGEQLTITEGALSSWTLVPAGRKGIGPANRLVAQTVVGSGAVSGLSVLGGAGLAFRHSVDWSSPLGRPVLVAALAQLFGKAADGSFSEQETALTAGGGIEVRSGPLLLRAIGEVGAVGVRQHGGAVGSVVAVQPRLDAQLGAAWPFSGDWSLELSVSGGGLLVHTDLGRNLQPFLVAQGGLGWGW